MQNFHSQGNKITIVASSSGLSGEPVVLDDRVGIAEHDYSSGDDLVVLLEGVVENLVKSPTKTFAYGEKLYWDTVDGVTDDDESAANKPIGWSVQSDAASGGTTAKVKLGAW
jgi:predicted RecA/RadA family phage recombinase